MFALDGLNGGAVFDPGRGQPHAPQLLEEDRIRHAARHQRYNRNPVAKLTALMVIQYCIARSFLGGRFALHSSAILAQPEAFVATTSTFFGHLNFRFACHFSRRA